MIRSTVPSATGQLLARRWVYHTLREVYLEPDGVIAKQFVHHRGRYDWRRVWAREHRALCRLDGLPVPRSLGYGRCRSGDGSGFILRKQYLAGEPLQTVGLSEAVEMARLLATIHQRGVVTGDPALANFVRTPQGGLAFIDFGRARTFLFRTPYFSFYVGKELVRFYLSTLQGCGELWLAASQAYRDSYSPSRQLAGWSTLSFRYWLWRKGVAAAVAIAPLQAPALRTVSAHSNARKVNLGVLACHAYDGMASALLGL